MRVELVLEDERETTSPADHFDVAPWCHPNDEEGAQTQMRAHPHLDDQFTDWDVVERVLDFRAV